MLAFCRDCFADLDRSGACSSCGSDRVVAHEELDKLTIAHLDCDAFYAAIEKRDDPLLKDKAVIVGGKSRRGVVLTCCYNARKFGVRSAMPMFQAMKLCPHATVVPPDMEKYAEAAREVRALLKARTPLVEPVSLDEAYLDLSGTERLHGMPPAKTMAKLSLDIEKTIGITVSIGLSFNKFLAKLASDLKKPRGFAVIGRAEAVSFLADKPVGMIRGVGPVLAARLLKDGITKIGQLQTDEAQLKFLYGDTGEWLHRLALGQDENKVEADGESKSVSAETTFETDISEYSELERILWDQCERLSARVKASAIGGRTVTLKLKTAKFRILTRSASLEEPTQLSDTIFRVGRALLKRETATGTKYRLLGIGLSHIVPAADCDPPNPLDERATRRAAVERAMDRVRAQFGEDAVKKGRSVRSSP
jgi:DNA polymerase-4